MIANQGALKVPLNIINTLISEHLCPAMPPTACIPIISQSRSHENGIIRDTDWRLIRLLPGAGGSLVIVDTCQTEIQILLDASKSSINHPYHLSFLVKACSTKSDVYHFVVMNINLRTANHGAQSWHQGLCTSRSETLHIGASGSSFAHFYTLCL